MMALPRPAPARVLACGAYLKNRACLIDGHTVHWSPVHGDLGEAASCIALEQSTQALLARASGPVQAIAHDLHPDFHSTRLALTLADQLRVPAIAVQHHHAHIAVALAEHGLEGPVLGLALDGVGLGTDGTAWGGEILAVHNAHVERLDHLPWLALPGGDRAAREPWRMAAAALHALGRGHEIAPRFGPVVGEAVASGVQAMLARGLRSPPTSSAGRWFDAAAAALGICLVQTTEAQAAMALEQHAQAWLDAHPEFNAPWPSLDLLPLLAELFSMEAPRGAAMFHLALANALAQRAIALATSPHVVLGGGCFFNRVLTERLTRTLQSAGLRVWRPTAISAGDEGLALGQAWVAACTLQTQGGA